jgi:phosphoribosylformylglycinamidine synthase subunit PurSL
LLYLVNLPVACSPGRWRKSPPETVHTLLPTFQGTRIMQSKMSGQPDPAPTSKAYRIEISSSLPTRPEAIQAQLPHLGITQPVTVRIQDLYFLEGYLTPPDLERLAALICDPVTESFQWQEIDDRVAPLGKDSCLEVALRAGVTDNTATQLQRSIRQIGINSIKSVATGQSYTLLGDLTVDQLHHIARSLLVNETVQRYTLGKIHPDFIEIDGRSDTPVHKLEPESISISKLDEPGLLKLSQERRLALDLDEMKAIQEYFLRAGRSPTDGELETLAQTWSEHCVHKTFKARIQLPGGEEIDGLLKSTIQAATKKIGAGWVRSAFVDNAGVIAFDDQFDLSFKVETHNHPSAIEPFGGANTGVGGVVRDNLGVSHRPIAVTDVLCFGLVDQPPDTLPEGVLHPRRIRSGVVAGVGDYGNKLGLATVNGGVIYHKGYTSNPLVYCGCVGIGPCNTYPREPEAGDRIIVVGGRTGRDGLRGATFSSLTMDAHTGRVAGAAVQIGDPITEKGVIEVVTRARDAGLYHAITDCGAGGLSSAVGEMSASIGARVQLERVPLKYAGLAPWEIWLSEAQERMVLAVPKPALRELAKLCDTYEVEWSDIGEFLPTARLEVFYDELPLVNLEEDFLHNGVPRRTLKADWQEATPLLMHEDWKLASEEFQAAALLTSLLSHPNIASKEDIIRQYDYEVRGATVVRPLVGIAQDGPSDAAVLKPLETSGWKGFVLANGANPFIGEADPYAMAISSVDEAIRNAVAVGGNPGQLALLDNFCWGDPRRPETLGSMVRAAQGCHDAALYYQTPFISGKDSLNNEYQGSDGKRHAIPGTLLISSIAIHPDVRLAVSMDLKQPGAHIYLVGDFQPALRQSHALLVIGPGPFEGLSALGQVPQQPRRAPEVYQCLHEAMMLGMVRAAHDISEGGLAVAAAEMCIAGRMGMKLDLAEIAWDPRLVLFGETNGCLLVEIAPGDAPRFENLFKERLFIKGSASDIALVTALGGCSSETKLRITLSGQTLIDLPVAELVAAFQSITE